MLCPDDLAPCRRADCGRGYCERTAASPLTDCRECGTVVEYRVTIAICAECVIVHSPTVDEES